VNSTALQVMLYAFVAASPLALASTLVVIGGPRRQALTFIPLTVLGVLVVADGVVALV
jgi:hypothetical protein